MKVRLVVLTTVLACSSLVPARSAEHQLPNLVALAPLDVRIDVPDQPLEHDRALRFGASVANRGAFGMDVVGMPRSEDVTMRPTSDAYQCVEWAADHVCAQRRLVGTFVWHPAHAHYHIEDFAEYELRSVAPDGSPDMSPGGLVATAGKVSYCMQDTSWDPGSERRVTYSIEDPLYTTCYPFQGISPGWADTYDYNLPGQEIIIDDVTDGRYYLMITTNPAGHLLETTREDNVSATLIELSGRGTNVTVLP